MISAGLQLRYRRKISVALNGLQSPPFSVRYSRNDAGPLCKHFSRGRLLSMVVGTHAVPGCDAALSRVCNEWAAKEKVQLKLDIVDGFNLLMTVFSEGRGKSGHDIAGLVSWAAASQAANLKT